MPSYYIGPAGSGQGQPLPGFLPAHLPRTPILCLPQSQQPTPGPQTVLCTDALRPVPAIQGSWEACGDFGLQPGQGSDGELHQRPRVAGEWQGGTGMVSAPGRGGGWRAKVPSLCRKWGGTPLTAEP